MQLLGAATLNELRVLNEANMRDRCVVLIYNAAARDGHNKPVSTWVDGEETACAYTPKRGREVRMQESENGSETVLADARLRLPIGSVITAQDRVRIINRFGQPIPPLTYEVIGIPVSGPTDIVVNLRLVRGR